MSQKNPCRLCGSKDSKTVNDKDSKNGKLYRCMDCLACSQRRKGEIERTADERPVGSLAKDERGRTCMHLGSGLWVSI